MEDPKATSAQPRVDDQPKQTTTYVSHAKLLEVELEYLPKPLLTSVANGESGYDDASDTDYRRNPVAGAFRTTLAMSIWLAKPRPDRFESCPDRIDPCPDPFGPSPCTFQPCPHDDRQT